MDKQESKTSPLHFGNMRWEPKNVAIASIGKGEQLEVVPRLHITHDTNVDLRFQSGATVNSEIAIEYFQEQMAAVCRKWLVDGELSKSEADIPESLK